MENILYEARLTKLLQGFIVEKLEPETIAAAADLDLIRFGIATTGDSVRFREAWKKTKEKRSHIKVTLMTVKEHLNMWMVRQQETRRGIY